MKVTCESRNVRAGSLEDFDRVGAVLDAVHVKAYTADLLDAHGLGAFAAMKSASQPNSKPMSFPESLVPKTGALAKNVGPGSTMCLPVPSYRLAIQMFGSATTTTPWMPLAASTASSMRSLSLPIR